MDMSGDDIRKYSDLWNWLRWEFPALPRRKPKVWEAFTRYARPSIYLGPLFPPSDVDGYPSFASILYPFLLPGWPPTIEVNSTDMMKCEEDGKEQLQKDGSYVQNHVVRWYGFTVPRYGANKILIASDIAQSTFGPESQVLEATILHELVHWTRLKALVADYDDEGPPRAFENDAYGKFVVRTWNTCYSPAYFKVP
ncbi:hypothetical protein JQ615_41835 [Bradyrhizobium jicamae]|uniref:Tox-MPTase3 domain-containing protein n=1 Tax=Bradyrhizobium jicamae TaxID=280332 RepID=A0ABS5FYJ8_9BRAD|nr:hypothetical protein [Bradyrhizobium jicamae]MBR0801872.1 hypothetical protein [Bradyrhizobium jicamae]